MRVAVTGASGVFGRNVGEHLLRLGCEVVALARREVELPRGCRFVSCDIRDADAVRSAIAGADAVVHLAWAVAPLRTEAETEAVNLGGTRNVIDACRVEDVGRLVFASSATAYGSHPDNPPLFTEDDPLRPDRKLLYAWHKARAEELVMASGIPHVITRTSPVGGRTLDNYAYRLLAAPTLVAPKGGSAPWQMAHEYDVGRFHALAAVDDRTGVVNLAPHDVGLHMEEIAALLGKRCVELSVDAIRKGAEVGWKYGVLEVDPDSVDGIAWMPVLDTRRLRETWGFEMAYSSRETVLETRRRLDRTTVVGPIEFERPWRLPVIRHRFVRDLPRPDGGELIDPSPPGMRGEFDGFVDPRYPRLSSANVSEAFPGPMTACSLQVALDCLGTTGAGMVDFLGIEDPELAFVQRRYPITSVGHRLYTNVSVVRLMAEAMPGTDPDVMEAQFLGHDPPEGASTSMSVHEVRRSLRLLRTMGPKIAGLSAEIARTEARARRVPREDGDLANMSDARLLAGIQALHDQLVEAWWANVTTNLVCAGTQTAASRIGGGLDDTVFLGGLDTLESGGVLRGVQELAAIARASSGVVDALVELPRDTFYVEMDLRAPAFARRFRRLIDEYGHRGRGETELSNPAFRDRPDQLLNAVVGAVQSPVHARPTPPPVEHPIARRLVATTNTWLRRRERARDAVIRVTHALRLALRERGRRLADAGTLEATEDVHHLTLDEVFVPERGAERIGDRRAERERLAALRLPTTFDLHWEPQEAGGGGGPVVLRGMAVSAGCAVGPARVLTSADGTLHAGEVLVTHVTDVGWTPLFASASAVVTDVGGALSHAAVVAREFGIPCVVATHDATDRIRNGQVVEVDGSAGMVRTVEEGAHAS